MKKFTLLFFLVFFTSFTFKSDTTKVYICIGPQSKKYHYDVNCKGLKTCSSDIHVISLEDAKLFGRTLCGYEKKDN